MSYIKRDKLIYFDKEKTITSTVAVTKQDMSMIYRHVLKTNKIILPSLF